jgi:hypothetical protein
MWAVRVGGRPTRGARRRWRCRRWPPSSAPRREQAPGESAEECSERESAGEDDETVNVSHAQTIVAAARIASFVSVEMLYKMLVYQPSQRHSRSTCPARAGRGREGPPTVRLMASEADRSGGARARVPIRARADGFKDAASLQNFREVRCPLCPAARAVCGRCGRRGRRGRRGRCVQRSAQPAHGVILRHRGLADHPGEARAVWGKQAQAV